MFLGLKEMRTWGARSRTKCLWMRGMVVRESPGSHRGIVCDKEGVVIHERESLCSQWKVRVVRSERGSASRALYLRGFEGSGAV